MSFAASPTFAAPGDLDTSFGNGGKVVTGVIGNSYDLLRDSAIQTDGKIIVVGEYSTNGLANTALVRYNIDGSLDQTFGEGGKVLSPYTNHNQPFTLAIQNDGRIVVGGAFSFENPAGDFALSRYNSDGSLDTAFGNSGFVYTIFNGSSSSSLVKALAIQNDGKIVAAGQAWFGIEKDRFVVARYNSDGSLDSSFGINGQVTTNLSSDREFVNDLIILPDGKLLVGGQAKIGPNPVDNNFALVRYNSNGSLDDSFDNNGIVTTDFSGLGDWIRSISIQSDNKIIVTGGSVGLNSSQTNTERVALARYNQDGSLDATFGINGKVVTSFDVTDKAFGVDIQQNGKIVVGGSQHFWRDESHTSADLHFLLLRYDSNGNLDHEFGTNGAIVTFFDGSNYDQINSLNIQEADGNIIVAGQTRDEFGGFDFGLARYLGDPINTLPDSSAGLDQTVLEGQQVMFDGSGSTDSDGVNDIVSYEWAFGDGEVGNGASSSHTYLDSGVYTATLTVEDAAGESDIDTATITVNNIAPTASFSSSPQTIIQGQSSTLSFINQYDPSTADTTVGFIYSFDCTNDGIFEIADSSTTTSFNCSYPNSGTYTALGRIKDKDGDYTDYIAQITVQTPLQATDSLVDLVETINTQQGINNSSLESKLNAALNTLSDLNENNDQAAVNSLYSFINTVEAQRGDEITSEQADALIAAANAIITSLN